LAEDSEPDARSQLDQNLTMCLAIPGRIIEIFPDAMDTALVDVAGVRRRVNLGLLQDDPPLTGDWVLIHVGFALSKISEQDAVEQMRTLQLLGEHRAAMEEVRGYGLNEDESGGEPPGEGQKPADVK
jgi:hydrogenase expression/formation protein HypC